MQNIGVFNELCTTLSTDPIFKRWYGYCKRRRDRQTILGLIKRKAGYSLRSNTSDPLRRISYMILIQRLTTTFSEKKSVGSQATVAIVRILVDMLGKNERNVRTYFGTKSQVVPTCKKPSVLSIAVACPRFYPWVWHGTMAIKKMNCAYSNRNSECRWVWVWTVCFF